MGLHRNCTRADAQFWPCSTYRINEINLNDKETNGLLQIGCSPEKLWKTEEAHRKENPRKHQCMEVYQGKPAQLSGQILAQAQAAQLSHSSSCNCIWLKQKPNIYSFESAKGNFCELLLVLNLFPRNFSFISGPTEIHTMGYATVHIQLHQKLFQFDQNCFKLQRLLTRSQQTRTEKMQYRQQCLTIMPSHN